MRLKVLEHILSSNNAYWKYPVLSELILARNVLNIPEIETWIDETFMEKTADNPEIQKWLKSNLKNFMVKEYEQVEPIRSVDDVYDAPEWLKKALEKGEEVFNVQLYEDKAFKDKIDHIIDFFRSPEAPPKLDRVTVPEAIKQSNEWTKRLSKKKVDVVKAEEGEEIVKTYEDGYTWRNLTTEAALTREGNLMGHCVGSSPYAKGVAAKTLAIWSLRDPKNEPHCTMELKPGSKQVQQIKGKGNKAVVEKYHVYVKDAVTDLLKDWHISQSDAKNAGLLLFEGKYVDKAKLKDDKEIVDRMVKHRLGRTDYTADESGVHVTMSWYGLAKYLEPLFKFKTDDTINYSPKDFDIKHENKNIDSTLKLLKTKHPEQYEKLMGQISAIAEKEQDPFSPRSSGYWLYIHKDNLPSYSNIVHALRSGWSTATQRKAKEALEKSITSLQFQTTNGEGYGNISKKEDGDFDLYFDWNGLIDGVQAARNIELKDFQPVFSPEIAEDYLSESLE